MVQAVERGGVVVAVASEVRIGCIIDGEGRKHRQMRQMKWWDGGIGLLVAPLECCSF